MAKNSRKASRETGGATAVATETQSGAVAPAAEAKPETPKAPPLFSYSKGKQKRRKKAEGETDDNLLFGEPDGNDPVLAVTVIKDQLFVVAVVGGRLLGKAIAAVAEVTGVDPTKVVIYKRFAVGQAPKPAEEVAEETVEE